MSEERKPIIQSIREFIARCPYLPEYYAALSIERLEENIGSYAVETSPTDPIVKRYANGASVRRFDFLFTSTEAYTREDLDQIANSAFYEHFAEWLETCSSEEKLPDLDGDDRLATGIKALTCGYVADTDKTTARYVIQCRLTYMQA